MHPPAHSLKYPHPHHQVEEVKAFESNLILVEFQSERAIGDALSAAIGPDVGILNGGFAVSEWVGG